MPDKKTSRGACRLAAYPAVLAVMCLAAGPAAAEVCDPRPAAFNFETPSTRQSTTDSTERRQRRPRWKRWRFCVVVTQDADGNWTLEGDRKTREIDIPPGHKADIIFLMDPELYPQAWLSGISIQRTGGGRAPRREFVTEDRRDFADGRKFEFRRQRKRFRLGVRNNVAGVYDYEVWIRTADSESDFVVDPRIRNRGRQH